MLHRAAAAACTHSVLAVWAGEGHKALRKAHHDDDPHEHPHQRIAGLRPCLQLALQVSRVQVGNAYTEGALIIS